LLARRRRVPTAIAPAKSPPQAQSEPFADPTGAVEQETPFTDAVPLHSSPEQEPDAVAEIFEVRKAFSAETQLWTSPAAT